MIAGGGTGGHLYPALALIEEIRRQDEQIKFAYVGTRRGLEARLLPTYRGVKFFPLHTRGLIRGDIIQNITALFFLVVAFIEAAVVIALFRPTVIVGMGGYSSFPILVWGVILRRQTMIHEQNIVAGLTNRLLSPFVTKVLLSYDKTEQSFPYAKEIIVTGNPIREDFFLAQRTDILYQQFNLNPTRKTILVFGGSHGSQVLTEQIIRAKERFSACHQLQVLLINGNDEQQVEITTELAAAGIENITTTKYIDNMANAFAIADLIVSRAGATSLAEIIACGKPAILIPWTGAAANHQWENARYLDAQKACILFDEERLKKDDLASLILRTINSEKILNQLATNARRLSQRGAATRMSNVITALN
jgi:UDP-N-acetylglucosamine--N-acetylmuramyl-(pentapeptide) pyrophosphoryl-undecaprenol N-acetylglucosamine transferase